MARQRYTTTSPTFSQDFMYQAPWELAMNALQFNEQQVDNLYGQADILKNAALSVPYLEKDRANVENEIAQINSQVDEITSALQSDPTAWKKQMPQIKSLSNSLQENVRTGNLSKIQGSYNALQAFDKEYEQLKKDDPATFATMKQYWLNNWQNNNERGSLDSPLKMGPAYKSVSLTDDRFRKIWENFKPDETTTIDGMYLHNNKFVSEAEVQASMFNLAQSDPEFSAYMGQQQMIGDPRYTSPIFLRIDTSTGKPITEEEQQVRDEQLTEKYQNFQNIVNDPNELKKYTKEQLMQMQQDLVPSYVTQLNPNNALSNQISGLSKVYSFKSSTTKGNPAGIAIYNQGQQNLRQQRQLTHAKQMQDDRQEHEKEILGKKHENALELQELRNQGKGTTKGKPKLNEKLQEDTGSGIAIIPSIGSTTDEDINFIKGFSNQKDAQGNFVPLANQWRQNLAASKVYSAADAARTKGLQFAGKDPKKIAIVNDLTERMRTGDAKVLNATKNNSASDQDDLIFEMFKLFSGNNRNKISQSSVANFMSRVGAAELGKDFAQQTDAEIKEYEDFKNTYGGLIKEVSGSYKEAADRLNTHISPTSSEAQYLAMNQKTQATKDLQSNINANITQYDWYGADDVLTPQTVTSINLTNVGPGAGVPAVVKATDATGKVIFGIPNNSSAKNNLIQTIAKNKEQLFSARDLDLANVYYDDNGEASLMQALLPYGNAANPNGGTSVLSVTRQGITNPNANARDKVVIRQEVSKVGGKDRRNFKIEIPGKNFGSKQTYDYNQELRNQGYTEEQISTFHENPALAPTRLYRFIKIAGKANGFSVDF